MKEKEELEFQRKVELTIKTIFFIILKIFLWGALLLIGIAILTSNSSLVYPTDENTNRMLVQIFVLGVLFLIISQLIKKYLLKKKK